MTGFVQSACFLVLLFCFISQSLCRPKEEKVTVLNHWDSRKFASCGAVMKAGYNVSGVYMLNLGKMEAELPCQFINGRAFTVILQRVSNVLSFIQPWATYEAGFGTGSSNYWAGLSKIYALTMAGQTNLHISAQDWAGNTLTSFYINFYLEDPSTRYRLHVSNYSGNLPDDLSYQNYMPFSTYDATDPNGCATGMKAGWWYNYCAYALPTGYYYNGGPYTPPGTMYDGIYFKDWLGYGYSLKSIIFTLAG